MDHKTTQTKKTIDNGRQHSIRLSTSSYLEVNLDSIDEEENDHDKHEDSIATVKDMAKKSLSFTKKKEMNVVSRIAARFGQCTPGLAEL